MKKLLIISLLIGSVYAAIIDIPGDYPTIQEGLDAAELNDTILVAPGLYQENLIINESITLASYALYDDLTEWYEFNTTLGQYELTNENIANTVIDGSQATQGQVFQSTILIDGIDDCIEPIIYGLTITGGKGSETVEVIEGEEVVRLRGGGILSNNALPTLHYNYIKENHIENIYAGGGVNIGTGIDFNERDGERDRLRCEGNVDLSHNFYRGNESLFGKTLATTDLEGFLDMSNSIFDVYSSDSQDLSEYWIKIEEDVQYDASQGTGDLEAITNDVWVNAYNGLDSSNYWGTESDPFLTINYALSRIYSSDDHPITINVSEGIYSPSSTSEPFPIKMISNVNLTGQNEELTILDAEQTDGVISITNCQNNILSNLTIINGHRNVGGGISIFSSNTAIKDVTVHNNISESVGGGIAIWCNGGIGGYVPEDIRSNASLTNVTIVNNLSGENAGGIFIENSDALLINVIIARNWTYIVGGAIWGLQANYKIINSIIGYNFSLNEYEGANNIFESLPVDSSIIVYSNILGDTVWIGEGNINTDPLFINPYSNPGIYEFDFSLEPDSPCIDIGTNYFVYNGDVIIDLVEDEYCGSLPDMGAYEFCDGLSNFNNTYHTNYSLNIPYPNPFNPITQISYEMPQNEDILISIYDLSGKHIQTLVEGYKTAGYHSISWDASSYPSGVYLILMESGSFIQAQKVLLIK